MESVTSSRTASIASALADSHGLKVDATASGKMLTQIEFGQASQPGGFLSKNTLSKRQHESLEKWVTGMCLLTVFRHSLPS